jgi:GNAT superfamily N-acetyltransferase
MPLTLSPLLPTEAHAFAVVDDAAMAGWPYAQAMAIGIPGPRIRMVEEWVRRRLENDGDETDRYLKVVDGETGEVIAGAVWRFEERDGGKVAKGEEKGEEEGEEEREEENAKMARAFAKARKNMWEEFERGWFEGEAYASEYPHATGRTAIYVTKHPFPNHTHPPDLQILVTSPSHRRRGAASMLIEWGTQCADERGLKSVLMASEAGLQAYLKHGFEVVREVQMDLRPFGVEAVELRRWMVREPRPVETG